MNSSWHNIAISLIDILEPGDHLGLSSELL
jgi:hypothetical protein